MAKDKNGKDVKVGAKVKVTPLIRAAGMHGGEVLDALYGEPYTGVVKAIHANDNNIIVTLDANSPAGSGDMTPAGSTVELV